jgi:hypothetical protein
MYGARHFPIRGFSDRRLCGAYDFVVGSLACSGVERPQRGRWLALIRFYRASICLVIYPVSARARSSMAVLADGTCDVFSFSVGALTILCIVLAMAPVHDVSEREPSN